MPGLVLVLNAAATGTDVFSNQRRPSTAAAVATIGAPRHRLLQGPRLRPTAGRREPCGRPVLLLLLLMREAVTEEMAWWRVVNKNEETKPTGRRARAAERGVFRIDVSNDFGAPSTPWNEEGLPWPRRSANDPGASGRVLRTLLCFISAREPDKGRSKHNNDSLAARGGAGSTNKIGAAVAAAGSAAAGGSAAGGSVAADGSAATATAATAVAANNLDRAKKC